MAFVVNMEDGLDVQNAAEKGRCRTDTAAALEVDQIVHRKPVAKIGQQPVHIGGDFLHRCTGLLFLHRQIDDHTLTGRGTQGVDDGNAALRVFFHQLRCSHLTGADGVAQAGGKTEVEDIHSLLQLLLKYLTEILHVGCGGLEHASLAHPLIENARRHIGVNVFL